MASAFPVVFFQMKWRNFLKITLVRQRKSIKKTDEEVKQRKQEYDRTVPSSRA